MAIQERFKALQQRQIELTNKRSGLVAEAGAILAKDTLSDEDKKRHDAIEADIKGLDGEIDAIKPDLDRYERQFERERNAPAVPYGSAARVTPNAAADPTWGFRSAVDFAKCVQAAYNKGAIVVDERLTAIATGKTGVEIGAAPTNFHQEGHSNDGYMVPPQIRDQVWELVFDDTDILAQVNPEPTSSNAVTGLADESTPWGSVGIHAYWTAEGALKTQSRLNTQSRTVVLHKLAALVTASDELLEDAPRLNARLTTGAANAIRWTASDAIMWGTGAGQPLGWMASPAKIAVAKEAGQAAETIVPKNLTNMFTRLLEGPGARVRWKANRDIMPQLVDLRIGNEPSWVGNNGGLKDAPNGMLLGAPIDFTEHAQTLGTEGDIQLVNLAGYYAIVKASGVKFDTSIHLFFDYDISAFRWTFRLGGMPFLSAPAAAAHGNKTKSHFVSLATRA